MPPSHRVDRLRAEELAAELLDRWPLPDHDHGDKFERGSTLVIGGTAETPGAALLAGTAALRVGAGRLQIATDPSAASAVAVAMPEARVVSLHAGSATVLDLVEQADAIAVGPGFAEGDDVVRLVTAVVERAASDAVVVLDAAAIAAVADHREAAMERGGRVVITPNRQELAALAAVGDGGDHHAAAVAAAFGVTVACFGYVAAPDGRLWRDPIEPCGLGTSGAGDVLAGAVAGLGARCHDGPQAACWATILHRVASNRLATLRAPLGYLARELADELAAAGRTMRP
jgi:hydroxyethylthiazole kinase-like uncharacterized protein yjeF